MRISGTHFVLTMLLIPQLVAVFLQEFTVQSHPKLKELKDCQLLLKTLIERSVSSFNDGIY